MILVQRVLLASQELRDSPESQDLPDRLDQAVALVKQDLRARLAFLESQVIPVRLAQLASLDRPAVADRLDLLASKVRQGKLALPARLDLWATLERAKQVLPA